MTEPTTAAEAAATAVGTTVSLTGSLVILLGPILGPWLAVFLAAGIGSLWTLGRVDTSSRVVAGFLLLRVILTALVLTGIVAALVADYVEPYLPDEHLLPAVAFGIAALGDKISAFRNDAIARIRAAIRGGAPQ